MSNAEFSAHALEQRYDRQRILRGFGLAAQERLAASRVLIVGAGGLGSPAAMYLAAAGVGALTLIDTDVIDVTNLHRQLLYATPDVGRRKLEVAGDRLQNINPHVRLSLHETRLNSMNAASLVNDHDVVIDATDNFSARYAINDACVGAAIPFVYGSVARFEGQLSVFAATGGPCYRCLFPLAPEPGCVPTCAEEGVLGVVPGIMGLYQATEAIKLMTGVGTPLIGALLLLDLLDSTSQRIAVARRADCATCSDHAPTRSRTGKHPPTDSNSVMSYNPDITPADLATRLTNSDAPIVLDVREPWEFETAHIAGSVLLPLSDLAKGSATFDKNAEYVAICHHGMRSEMACGWLRQNGFTNIRNLVGGIDAYSLSVDPSLPRY